MNEKSKATEYTIHLRGEEYSVTAERFVVDDHTLGFLNGTELVAAFANWDAVL